MAGDKAHACCQPAMGQRYARCGSTSSRRRDTGNDLDLDIVTDEVGRLLAAAAKNKWVTAFETDGNPFGMGPNGREDC